MIERTPAFVVPLMKPRTLDDFFCLGGEDAAASSISAGGTPEASALCMASSVTGVWGARVPGGGGGGRGALLASPIRRRVIVSWALVGTPYSNVLGR